MNNIKVKYISTDFTPNFEDKINDFIKDKDVIDISYQCFSADRMIYHNALIIYKERKSPRIPPIAK